MHHQRRREGFRRGPAKFPADSGKHSASARPQRDGKQRAAETRRNPCPGGVWIWIWIWESGGAVVAASASSPCSQHPHHTNPGAQWNPPPPPTHQQPAQCSQTLQAIRGEKEGIGRGLTEHLAASQHCLCKGYRGKRAGDVNVVVVVRGRWQAARGRLIRTARSRNATQLAQLSQSVWSPG